MSSPRSAAVPTPTTFGPEYLDALRRGVREGASALDRALPWTRHGDPWAILVSEVMLQQTSVARVSEPWASFLVRFPTPRACAEANQSDVLRAWGGLGFPRRARNLHQSAKRICDVHGGNVPRSVADLESLPGVGSYTARAVSTFAFGLNVGVVDTNVGRVLARCVANQRLTPVPAQQLADALVDPVDPARFNQTMLDIGARHCRKSPRCDGCPLVSLCRWRREGGDDPAVRSAGVSRAQGVFCGSDREARGRLLSELRVGELSLVAALRVLDSTNETRARTLLDGLISDRLVASERGRVQLADG